MWGFLVENSGPSRYVLPDGFEIEVNRMNVTARLENRFKRTLRPLLETKDSAELLRSLEESWPEDLLAGFLTSEDPDVVKLAAHSLSLRGSMDQNEALAKVLHHDDPVAASMAEHALWSIWFRAGSPEANRRLRRTVERMDNIRILQTVRELTNLTASAPFFAEVYNQRAITYYLMGAYEKSIQDCRRTIDLNPYHFGATAGLGHCYAHLGKYQLAADAYHRALAIHPRLDGVRQSIHHLNLLAGRGCFVEPAAS
jgi:tetratricopeptide (TPR) repeat protein